MGSGNDLLVIYGDDSVNGSYITGADGSDTIAVRDSGATVLWWGGDAGQITLSSGSVIGFGGVENVQIACFAEGTRIATSRGPVLTLDHGPQPLRALGRRRLLAGLDQAPVRFAPGTIGNEGPLILSLQHRVMLRSAEAQVLFGAAEVLVAAHHLVDGIGIRRLDPGPVTYYHLLFDRHEIVFAEGAEAESFMPVPSGQGCDIDAGLLGRECRLLMPELLALATDHPSADNLQAARRVLRRHEAALLVPGFRLALPAG